MEYMIVNPTKRRRARRRKGVAASSRRRRRRTRNPVAMRFTRRRRARRRRNPSATLGGLRLPRLGGLNLGEAVSGAAGFIGAEALTGIAANAIPVEAVKSGVGRIALKAGLVAFGSGLVGRFAGKGIGRALAIGGGIAVAVDVYRYFIAPMNAALPQLSGYELDGYTSTLGEYTEGASEEAMAGLMAPAWSPSWQR